MGRPLLCGGWEAKVIEGLPTDRRMSWRSNAPTLLALDLVLHSSTQETDSTAASTSGFRPLNLSETMLTSLDEAGYLEPTPIQAGLIPRALAGVDLMGQAQTGTGKTAAFAIPILERLEPPVAKRHGPQALILVPTRELAVQVRDECVKLAAGQQDSRRGRLRRQADPPADRAALAAGPRSSSARPAACWTSSAAARSSSATSAFVVLDEADRMLDIGFRPDIEKILRRCPQSRQTLLLERHDSAAGQAAGRALHARARDARLLAQGPGGRDDRAVLLHGRSRAEVRSAGEAADQARDSRKQAIVFCRTKRGTDKVEPAAGQEVRATSTRIHGDLPQIGPRPRDAPLPRGQDQGAGGHRRGGPRHRRDAASRTSSTTTFRSSATTTCIAWAAPAGWAARAWPSPSSRPRKATS